MVRGSSGWKWVRMGAEVKACWRAVKAAAAAADQVNLTALRVREVRGVAVFNGDVVSAPVIHN